MGPWRKMLVHVAWSGILLSGVPAAVLPAAAQQAQPRESANADSLLVAKAEAQPAELPDSPGAVVSKAEQSALQQSAPQQPDPRQDGAGTAAPAFPPAQSQPAQNQTQSQPQKPVGTAAAESPDASGIAASQPAGVAIAPAKQRRVRTIVVRMGAIIGAGVAVGSVVALTAGTSSKPPGAH